MELLKYSILEMPRKRRDGTLDKVYQDIDLSPTLLISTFHVNGLNTTIQRQKWSNCIKNKVQIYATLKKIKHKETG